MGNSQKPSLKSSKRESKGKSVASSNWHGLKKVLDSVKLVFHRKKRRKLGQPKHITASVSSPPEPVSLPPVPEQAGSTTSQGNGDMANENFLTSLRSMVLALEDKFNDEQRLPGRYLALDCEMVGVGINASESSLARVSLVNYHGAVIMDEYVRQRERVVDYRTRWSGIRASNMINAKPFEEVQKAVNDLLDGRILIGHAVYNDLKALLLSHPTRQTRDTQVYAYKFALSKSRHISLKNLAKQELEIDIQNGEHSSVVDARVTMAIYRLHKKDWERASGTTSRIPGPETAKRKWSTQVAETDGSWDADGKSITFKSNMQTEEVEEISPTSNMHKRKRAKTSRGKNDVGMGEDAPRSKHAWWKSLPSGSAKAYVRLDTHTKNT